MLIKWIRMLLPLRHSSRPSKQLFWLWFARDLKQSSKFQRGIDVACGKMIWRPMFRTTTYTGIDADAERIAIGKARNPDANGVVSTIEEIPPELKGDFVCCVQTIGFNRLFEHRDSVAAVNGIVDIVEVDGVLLLNTGPACADMESQIESKLRSCFKTVRKSIYGNMNKKQNQYLSVLLSYAMLVVPFLRIGNRRNVYYRCFGRLPSD